MAAAHGPASGSITATTSEPILTAFGALGNDGRGFASGLMRTARTASSRAPCSRYTAEYPSANPAACPLQSGRRAGIGPSGAC
jgi:hypothetical protein